MKTVIVDYGMGNLRSVLNSVREAERLAGTGTEIVLSARPEDVAAADKIIFPGQGAMPDCMAALQHSGLGEAVLDGLKPPIWPLHFWIKLDISLQSQHYAAHAAATSVLFLP